MSSMKWLILSFPIALAGCGGMLGDDRMKTWREVRLAEEQTNQVVANAMVDCKIADANKKTKRNPTLKITSLDSAGNPVVVEMDLQPVIAEILGEDKTINEGAWLKRTPMPQGEFAENMKATGNAVKDLAHTPSVLVGTTGYFASEVITASGGGGTSINAESVDVSNAFNRDEVHATGNENTVTFAKGDDSYPVYPEHYPDGE